jgi:hypothetical protein
LVGWACPVEPGALDGLAAAARAAGLAAGVGELARRRPDGRTVVTRRLVLGTGDGSAHLPVFVEPGRGAHPSMDAPGGLRLRSFSVADPDPDGVRKLLAELGVEIAVVEGAPGLAAVLGSPIGELTLGS